MKHSLHRLIRNVACVAVDACALAVVAVAQNSVSVQLSDAEQSLLNTEDQILQAKVRRDAATIAQGFADEAVYMHANGRSQTKSEYLQAVASSTLPYRSIATQDRVVRIFGEVGITRGAINMVVGERQLSDNYLAVYIKRDARWQLLDWRTTPALKSADNK